MDGFIHKRRRAVLEVLASAPKERRGGKFLNTDYIPADEEGYRYIYPGMVLAEVGAYYVPYNTAGSYGTGSDTAVGILREFHNGTLFMPMVSPVTEGTFIEQYCYEFGETLGEISADIKTDLKHIQWK